MYRSARSTWLGSGESCEGACHRIQVKPNVKHWAKVALDGCWKQGEAGVRDQRPLRGQDGPEVKGFSMVNLSDCWFGRRAIQLSVELPVSFCNSLHRTEARLIWRLGIQSSAEKPA